MSSATRHALAMLMAGARSARPELAAWADTWRGAHWLLMARGAGLTIERLVAESVAAFPSRDVSAPSPCAECGWVGALAAWGDVATLRAPGWTRADVDEAEVAAGVAQVVASLDDPHGAAADASMAPGGHEKRARALISAAVALAADGAAPHATARVARAAFDALPAADGSTGQLLRHAAQALLARAAPAEAVELVSRVKADFLGAPAPTATLCSMGLSTPACAALDAVVRVWVLRTLAQISCADAGTERTWSLVAAPSATALVAETARLLPRRPAGLALVAALAPAACPASEDALQAVVSAAAYVGGDGVDIISAAPSLAPTLPSASSTPWPLPALAPVLGWGAVRHLASVLEMQGKAREAAGLYQALLTAAPAKTHTALVEVQLRLAALLLAVRDGDGLKRAYHAHNTMRWLVDAAHPWQAAAHALLARGYMLAGQSGLAGVRTAVEVLDAAGLSAGEGLWARAELAGTLVSQLRRGEKPAMWNEASSAGDEVARRVGALWGADNDGAVMWRQEARQTREAATAFARSRSVPVA
jgi:hypothetical protein